MIRDGERHGSCDIDDFGLTKLQSLVVQTVLEAFRGQLTEDQWIRSLDIELTREEGPAGTLSLSFWATVQLGCPASQHQEYPVISWTFANSKSPRVGWGISGEVVVHAVACPDDKDTPTSASRNQSRAAVKG